MFRTILILKRVFSFRFENGYSIPYRKLSLVVTWMVPNFFSEFFKIRYLLKRMEPPIVLKKNINGNQ